MSTSNFTSYLLHIIQFVIISMRIYTHVYIFIEYNIFHEYIHIHIFKYVMD